MTADRFVHEGETWVTVEAVAECYRVDERLVCDACRAGLLLYTEDVAGVMAIAVHDLDKLSVLIRLHVYQGVPLESVALYLTVRHA